LANGDHGTVARMSTDDLAAATAALRAARDEVDGAQDRAAAMVAEARAEVERKRSDLATAIVDAAKRGVRQREIVRVTGYSRERVRQICRAAGLESDEG
jgi:acyl-CoA reductase-like NAD-dependent aldehyde dehydrogenase